jgi:hypothetical protein
MFSNKSEASISAFSWLMLGTQIMALALTLTWEKCKIPVTGILHFSHS